VSVFYKVKYGHASQRHWERDAECVEVGNGDGVSPFPADLRDWEHHKLPSEVWCGLQPKAEFCKLKIAKKPCIFYSLNFLPKFYSVYCVCIYYCYNHFTTLCLGYTGEPLPEEIFTNSHLSWLSIILYQLPPSTAIHSILSVQFMCLTVFLHNLFPSPLVCLLAWYLPFHTPYIPSQCVCN